MATQLETQPNPVRAYLSEMGRRGAAVHSLTQEARLLGVRVRLLKKNFTSAGYSPSAAHQRARAAMRLNPGGFLSR